MSDKASMWGGIIAVITAGGSLAGGLAAFLNNREAPAPAAQVAPAVAPEAAGSTTPEPAAPAAPVPAAANAAAATPPAKPPAPAEQVRQANLSAADHAQLQQVVSNYLDNVQKNFGPNMNNAGQELASLQPGTSYDWGVSLEAGVRYLVVGACDNECSNVDIQLVDPGGSVVAQDVLADDFPVVDFTPAASGAYQVRMLMRTCTFAPCYAGARLLAN